ncbi:MAG: hypothetical protein AB4426_00845 [Xenococcaceae cyanobacterium]
MLQSLAVACCLLPVALSSQLTLLLSDYLVPSGAIACGGQAIASSGVVTKIK